MSIRIPLALATLAILATLAAPSLAQDRGAPPGRGGPPKLEPTAPLAAKAEKIAWYGVWEEGLAEAKRTGKPILLVSAAPHCHNISGVW